ncbi:Carbohydrate sulfotransferase 14, partial [Desmophyllum pertusum]
MKPNPPIDLRFIVVDDENKIIYCTVPKVATSTWKRILGDLRGLKQGINIHQWDLWRWLYQYTEEEWTQRLQTYFKFVFVREPLNRLLSAYKNKFIGKDRR